MSRPDLDARSRKLAGDADRLQRDTRLDAWRTPGRRRGLVLATIGALAAVMPSMLVAWGEREL